MRHQVNARDGLCRFPGCHLPATGCELDHVVPWVADGDGGRTSEPNLLSTCRRHHDLKTRTIWSSLTTKDGDAVWTGPAGREYTTRPENWLAATGALRDGDSATYRWLRHQLECLLESRDTVLDPAEAIRAMDEITSPRGRQVLAESHVEAQLAELLDAWWGGISTALDGVEIWHHTAGGALRRGPGPALKTGAMATESRDVATESRDVATESRDVATESRDADTESRDADTESRDVATESPGST
jgi:hypothetical protein